MSSFLLLFTVLYLSLVTTTRPDDNNRSEALVANPMPPVVGHFNDALTFFKDGLLEANPRLPEIGQCVKYLHEEWSGSWIETYKYNDGIYSAFGSDGSLYCFHRGKILIAQELNCVVTSKLHEMNKPAREAALGITNFTVGLNNCLHLHQVLTHHEPGQSGYLHSMYLKIPLKSIVRVCYMIGNLYNVPIEMGCPDEIKWAKINPKNFMFIKNGTVVYRSPTWDQYLTLRKMGHPSVQLEDYDYDHENDYFVSDWQ